MQATAPRPEPFGAEAFTASSSTTLRWLGMAGWLVNSRGTTLMIDPLLEGFDMPLLIHMPITVTDVPRLDAVLVTHADNDHYSRPTCQALRDVTTVYHSTRYVASVMTGGGLPAEGHDIGDTFDVPRATGEPGTTQGAGGTPGGAAGVVRVQVTPADHAWQNATPGAADRVFADEDSCGFWINTPDGTVWAPGDSRLIPDHHLAMPAPDALLFDFSDSEWHFTLAGAARMANAYPDTPLLLHHWGCVDAPDFPPFNGNPADLDGLIDNPERIHILAPGQAFTLERLKAARPDDSGGPGHCVCSTQVQQPSRSTRPVAGRAPRLRVRSYP